MISWIREHPFISVAIPLLFALIGAPVWLGEVGSLYALPLSKVAVSQSGIIETWFLSIAIAVTIWAITSSIVSIFLWKSLSKKTQDNRNLSKKLSSLSQNPPRGDLNAIMSRMRSMVNKVDKRPNCESVSILVRVTVMENGDVDYVRAHKLCAKYEKTFFHILYEESDASGSGALGFEQTELSVTTPDVSAEVVMIPTENLPHRKEFAIFFVPPLAKGEERVVEIRHKWPGYAADLISNGQTTFYWQTLTSMPTSHMATDVEIYFVPKLGAVECAVIGPSSNQSQLTRSLGPTGGAIWKFLDPTFPLGTGELLLECKLSQTAP